MSDRDESAIPDHSVYEAPAIAERTEIDLPLVAVISGDGGSAAFHPADADERYEARAIAERTEIDHPLVATAGGSPPCPAFRE